MLYTGKSGDNLSAIAVRNGISVSDILKANPKITHPNTISVGQSITIPVHSHRQSSNVISGSSTQRMRIPGVCGLFSRGADKFARHELTIKTFASHVYNCSFFDRKKFFDKYRDTFGKLSQGQVDGISALLKAIEGDDAIQEIPHVAYMFATVKHETADKFQPITEYGSKSYFNKYDPILADTATRRQRAKDHGNTVEGDGYTYRSRGYVQITWKNNYEKLGKAISTNLVTNPDHALKPQIAYKIMSYGMRNGSFTGKKLSDYLNAKKTDYTNARKIINGLDKADLIKGYAEKFETILKYSVVK